MSKHGGTPVVQSFVILPLLPAPPVPSPLYAGHFKGITFGDLDLSATLRSGQAFRWKQIRTSDAQDEWQGAVGSRLVRLAQNKISGDILWEASGVNDAEAEAAVRSFLRLDEVDLPDLARAWCQADPLFARAWENQPGVRILRQHPDECFFSFLCASVAPIARIGKMLDAVAQKWGTPIGSSGVTAFPDAVRLSNASEAELKAAGLGFRAKRVASAARVLAQLPTDHLTALRTQATHAEAKRELTTFFGVGEKIADCVCLFSLDKEGAVPVDVHIWRVAQARYAPDLAGKSLTLATYARAVQSFHDTFGPYAGWAQQTLFYRAAVDRVRL